MIFLKSIYSESQRFNQSYRVGFELPLDVVHLRAALGHDYKWRVFNYGNEKSRNGSSKESN